MMIYRSRDFSIHLLFCVQRSTRPRLFHPYVFRSLHLIDKTNMCVYTVIWDIIKTVYMYMHKTVTWQERPCTVELWYKDHLWAATEVVFIVRWSLLVYWGGSSCDLSWTGCTKSGLYTKLVFNQGSTVYLINDMGFMPGYYRKLNHQYI